MKLFLLNTMENQRSMKIGLTLLGFFYNFLHISKVGQKKKREKEKQYWAKSGSDGLGPRGNARAHAHAGGFSERPLGFWLTRTGFTYYSSESLTICTEVPQILFLHRPWSPTVHGTTELRRASRPAKWNKDWLRTSAETKSEPV
jgi:hypothetical protein